MNNFSGEKKKIAIIIGGGPAGLTAAFELAKRSDIKPIVLERSDTVGGISRTVEYKGNWIDIGGHRFFSKSDRVMKWWAEIFPLQTSPAWDDKILSRKIETKTNKEVDPEKTDKVMLVRNRLSRIFFLQRFFDYPISIKWQTFKNLGVFRVIKIGFSYLKIKLFPLKQEENLENFFVNRFGRELYLTFFKDYTEKLWGIPCDKLSADWGSQRVKGISITVIIKHALKSILTRDKSVNQRKTETSLIERFIYPKLGPGQLWREVARQVEERGGRILFNQEVQGMKIENNQVKNLKVFDRISGETKRIEADYVVSSMPLKNLISGIEDHAPKEVQQVAQGLKYRDFITVGILAKKLKLTNQTKIKTVNNIIPDTWLYIQEREVRLCRIQIFNNWSPYLVKEKDKIWLGVEYVCNVGDDLWSKTDDVMADFAINELAAINVLTASDVVDKTVIRSEKVYPVYYGTYYQLDKLRGYTDKIKNLYLIGRNGMHRYNNQDHSMLTAMEAVENIISGRTDKDNIWQVNSENDYHEEKENKENE